MTFRVKSRSRLESQRQKELIPLKEWYFEKRKNILWAKARNQEREKAGYFKTKSKVKRLYIDDYKVKVDDIDKRRTKLFEKEWKSLNRLK